MANYYDVYFGSALAVDGFGFVGRGTITVTDKTLIFDGKKSWSALAKIGIFLLVTLVPLVLFGFGLGFVLALVLIYYFCASKGNSSISRSSVHTIRRKGRTISFKAINPDTGKEARAIFIARNEDEAERLEGLVEFIENVAIG
jgi:hypothetical protein